MGMYFKGYGGRIKSIVEILLISVISLLIVFVLFQGKIEHISGQLKTYDEADYEKLYVLNYDIPLENECLYPDSDLMVFCDKEKTSRLTVSTIMAKQNSNYTLDYLVVLNCLNNNEIAISQNVAKHYKIEVGDTLFVEYPYSSELRNITVHSILSTDFDYQNPTVSNNVGIAFIGNDENYQSLIQSKAILYAMDSKTNELSEYSQVISSIIEKQTNRGMVLRQGITVLLYEIAFSILAIILSHLVFFSKSQRMLKCCYFKGTAKSSLVFVPLLEKIIFGLLPTFIIQMSLFLILPRSNFTIIYFLIPCVLYALFCIFTGLRDTFLVKRG